MTVWVVVCADPADCGSECWTHGVYASEQSARRVFRRLRDDTYWTVRIDRKRVSPAPAPKEASHD